MIADFRYIRTWVNAVRFMSICFVCLWVYTALCILGLVLVLVFGTLCPPYVNNPQCIYRNYSDDTV